MMYEVTYQVGGEEHTDRVDAPDAAAAAAMVRDTHIRASERFELLLVQLLEQDQDVSPTCVNGDDGLSAPV